MTDLASTLARLYALAPRGARYGLEPMREACAREGDPQESLRAVHVAGTNGKGSVCATVDAIARAARLKTGLYTSPHLVRYAERIRLDGTPIDDARLALALAHVMDRHPDLTFFEVTTLAAFLIFVEANVDLAILEVGLGGRFDATNVIPAPLATAVTGIALDHTEFLGTTIASIAFEKAGIVKPNAPLVLGRMSDEAAEVILARADAVGVKSIARLGADFTAEPRGALVGAHQRDNAAVAVALAKLLREAGDPTACIDDDAIARGLEIASWPGRFERLHSPTPHFSGRFILDGAHNVDGALALARALTERDARDPRDPRDPRDVRHRRALVFGAMADKPWREMIATLAELFDARVYVQPSAAGAGRRGATAETLRDADPSGIAAQNLADAIARARAAVGDEGTVVVAGSLYLVGEARALLVGEARDPHVGL